MRDSIDKTVAASRSANLTNLFDNLGAIGRENFTFNQAQGLADSGAFGRLNNLMREANGL
jgi:hypothetical protein